MYRKTLILMLMIFTSVGLFAINGIDEAYQKRIVTGTVFELETGETLPGVSVFIKDTQKGTMTDANGKYTLEADSERAILVFNFIGKKRLKS